MTPNTQTYKVTYFDKEMDIESIITYHNIESQGDLTRFICTRILTLDLLDRVKMEGENGRIYTRAVNDLLPYELEEMAEELKLN